MLELAGLCHNWSAGTQTLSLPVQSTTQSQGMRCSHDVSSAFISGLTLAMKLLKSLERQEPNVATNTREVLSSASGQALLLARTGSPGVEKVTPYLGDEEVGLFESKNIS